MRLLACAMFASLALGANVSGVQAVYLLPMTGGLDQFLASRLASAHVFRIVTDPKLADAVFTDQLGETFEQKLTELYPPPTAQKPKDGKDDRNPPIHSYTGVRGRGTLFLVDLKSREVVWSANEKPVGGSSAMLDREAMRIVHQIQKQQKVKKEQEKKEE